MKTLIISDITMVGLQNQINANLPTFVLFSAWSVLNTVTNTETFYAILQYNG